MATINSKERIDFFIKELQAKKPSPGGGAVAALVGALGVGLIMKVANYTLGKKKYKRHEKEVKVILNKAGRLKNKLCALIEKDAKAYEAYSRTKSKATIKRATLCVENISKLSKDGLKFYQRLKGIGNINLKGDLDAAGIFLNGSLKVADELIRSNKMSLLRPPTIRRSPRNDRSKR